MITFFIVQGVKNYELRVGNYELRDTGYELRITNYELWVKGCVFFLLKALKNRALFEIIK